MGVFKKLVISEESKQRTSDGCLGGRERKRGGRQGSLEALLSLSEEACCGCLSVSLSASVTMVK